MISQETDKIKEIKDMTQDLFINRINIDIDFSNSKLAIILNEVIATTDIKSEDKLVLEKILTNAILEKNKEALKYYRNIFKYENNEEVIKLLSSINERLELSTNSEDMNKELNIIYFFLYYISSNSYSPQDKKSVLDSIKTLYSLPSNYELPIYDSVSSLTEDIKETYTKIEYLKDAKLSVKELETSYYKNIEKMINRFPIMLYQSIDSLESKKYTKKYIN